MQKKLKWN